jgi:hypothetical protein
MAIEQNSSAPTGGADKMNALRVLPQQANPQGAGFLNVIAKSVAESFSICKLVIPACFKTAARADRRRSVVIAAHLLGQQYRKFSIR